MIFTMRDTFAWLKHFIAGPDTAFIVGSALTLPDQGEYNIAACLTHHGQDVQVYRKMHLVPFGEYIRRAIHSLCFAKIAGQLVGRAISRRAINTRCSTSTRLHYKSRR